MRSILTTIICLAFGGPLFAADPPAPKSGGPFEGGAVMNSADKANCKLAIRLAARIQRLKGKISRDELQTVLAATDNREAMAVVNDHVQDMVLEQSFAGQKAGPRAAGGWLSWILDNFPQILQMVMQIIALFSQNMPADGLQYCSLDAAEVSAIDVCGGCPGGQCTIERAVTITMPDTPTRSVCILGCTKAPPKADPLFSPRRGNWWDRGPARRLLSAPWRGNCAARR